VTRVFLVFVAGSSDRAYVLFDISYSTQIWVYRVLVFALPVVACLVTHRVCRKLQARELVAADRHRAEAEARVPATAAGRNLV
jgi:hypothetical protein